VQESDEYVIEEELETSEEVAELVLGEDDVEDDGEIVMDLGSDDEGDELVLGDEEDEELNIDFDDMEDAVSGDEITLEFDDDEKEVTEVKEEGLPLDFGEIDISDLAPPDEESEVPVTETLSLDEEPAQEVALATAATVAAGSGLEDLHVDDLDLEVAAPLVAGSKAGGKLMPSVKTGTALDDFEIDLGELTNDEK
jgi:hypothetical protein